MDPLTELPDPAELLEKAQQAPSRLTQEQLVHRYSACVQQLRRLGYSDKKIAEWLRSNGVPLPDHKVVFNYRKKHNIK